jgi:ABC-type transport system involved in multi-copper enzyme maturation permease subunit
MVPPSVYKEFRALLPTWVACAVVMGLGIVPSLHSVNAVTVQLLAYIFGTIALGAQSIGHEYDYRTLGLQLSQPIERRRLLLTKVSVLMPMLVTLAVVMWWMLLAQPLPSTSAQLTAVVVPPLAALLLAPCVTMMSRSQLAGTVLTLALLGTVWLVVGVWAIPGIPVIIVLYTAGGLLGWRMFMTLEAIDGAGTALNVQGRQRQSRVRDGRPVAQLVKKELHIQQLTFVMVGIYLVAWAVLANARHQALELRDFPLSHLTMFYAALLCLLIGSLASAEERQLGTLEWQTLLPVPRWRQWSIKVGVTMVLTLLLGVGVPLLLMRISPSLDDKSLTAEIPGLALGLIVAVTVSLYVSSVSTSGVRALVVAMPAALCLIAFVKVIASVVLQVVPSLGPAGLYLFRTPMWFYQYFSVIALAVVGMLLFVVLRFAGINHSLADRSVRRVGQQLAWVAGFVTSALVTLRLLA